jgi:uncharacterized protein (TIGR02246 family)
MRADEKREKEIKAVVDKYAELYTKKDLDGIMALFSPDPDVVVYGSGQDEKRVGHAEIRAQIMRDFSQAEALSFGIDWYSVSAIGTAACFAGDVTIRATAQGQEMELPRRFTCVLEKRDDRWLIAQGHFSVPAGDQPAGQSYPRKGLGIDLDL